jgi:hypothetical protein
MCVCVQSAESGNVLVPRKVALLRDSNAVHLVLASPIVADLSTMVRLTSHLIPLPLPLLHHI